MTDFLIHKVESGQAPYCYNDYLCSWIASFNHGKGTARKIFWCSFVLCEACCSGQERSARWALDRGADPHIYYTKPGAAAHRVTALEAATRFGHVEIVKLLLNRGAELVVNSKGAGGIALSRAVMKLGHTGMVKLMLANGYNINDDCRHSSARTDPRVPPVSLLLESVKKNRVHSLLLLLEVGLKLDITKGQSVPTSLVCEMGQLAKKSHRNREGSA